MQFNRLQLNCSLALFTYHTHTHTHTEKHCIDKVSKLQDDDAS